MSKHNKDKIQQPKLLEESERTAEASTESDAHVQNDVVMTVIEPRDEVYCPLLSSPIEDSLFPCMAKRCGFFVISARACSLSVIGHEMLMRTGK